MKSYVAPKFVFDREPNKIDSAVRASKQAAAIARALLSRADTETAATHRMFEADEDLRAYGFGFTEHWRAVLGDRLNRGVRLRTSNGQYAIEAVLTKDDTLPQLETIDRQYETNMDITVTQSNGYTTRLRMKSRTAHPNEHAFYHENIVPMVFMANVMPMTENWRINGDGWGWYTQTEDAQLSEVTVRVMRELNEASVTPGMLEITDL